MPEGANVGEVYLEGRLEFDDKSTPAFAAAVRRSMEAAVRSARIKEAFASAISEGTDEGLSNASRSASVQGRRIGDNAGDAAKSSLERRLRDLDVRLPNLDLPIGEAMRDIDRVRSELQSLRTNDASIKVHADTAEAERELDKLQATVKERFERDHRSFLSSAFEANAALTQTLFETLRTGVSRALVGVFSSPAGIGIGIALAGALATGLGTAATLIGSALTGAIVGGLGIGTIAGGIALVADHPKIQEAGSKIWQKLMGPDKEGAVEAVAKARQKRDEAQERLNKLDATGGGSTAPTPAQKTQGLMSAEYDLQIAKTEEERARVQARIDKMHATGTAYTAPKPGGPTEGRKSAEYDLTQANEELATAEKTLADIEAKGPGLLKKAAEPFVEPTARGIEILGASLEKVMPHIENIMKAMAPYVEKFATALGSVLEKVLPAFEKLIIASTPVMDAIVEIIEAIGPALASFFEKLAADPAAMQGAAIALKDISFALIGLLPALGDFLVVLARNWPTLKDALKDLRDAWNDLTEGDDGPGGIQTMFDNAEQAIRMITAVIRLLDVLSDAWDNLRKNIGSGIGGWFDELGASLGRAKDQAVGLGQGIKTWFEDLGASLGRAKDQAAGIWDNIKTWFGELGTSLQTAKDQAAGIGQGVKDWFLGLGESLKTAKDQAAELGNGIKNWFVGLGESLQTAKDQAINIWNGVVDWWKNTVVAGFKTSIDDLKDKWKTFRDNIDEVFGNVQTKIDGVKNWWKNDVVGDWKSSIEDFKDKWKTFRDNLDEVWTAVQSKIDGIKNWWTNEVVGDWKASIEDFKEKWKTFRDNVNEFWGNVQDKIDGVKNWWRDEVVADWKSSIEDLKEKWKTFRDNLNDFWSNIQEKIDAVKRWWKDEVVGDWKDTIEDLKSKWQTFREKLDEIWAAVQRKIDEFKIWFLLNIVVPLLKAKQDLENGFENLKVKINEVFDRIREKINEVITWLRVNVWDPLIQFVTVTIPERFAEMAGKVIGIWDRLRTGISDIWNDMLRSGAEKINALIDLVNGVIKAVNSVPFIPDLPEISYRASGPAPAAASTPPPRDYFAFARGGAVHGGPPGTDTVPAMGPGGQRYRLDNGEHIWTKSEVDKIGGHGVMYGLRAAVRNGIIGMAAGGRVSGENNGLLNEHADHVHVAMSGPPMSFPAIIAAAAASGIPFSVASTFRPGDRVASGGLSHHATGRAVDFGGHEQDKLAEYFEKLPGVIELIHRTATRDYAIFGGGDGGGAFSWLLTAAGKAAKGVLEAAVNALKSGVQSMLPGADKKLAPGMLGGVFGGLGDAALKWFDEQVSMLGQVGPGNPDKNVMKVAYETAKSMGASSKLLLALFEAGFVESGFRNLGHQGAANDHDSLGFLQQRPSAGWPSPMDVPTATRSFISRALRIHGQHDTAGSLAQAVQISAFPERYQQRRAAAIAALREFDPNFEPNGFAEGGRVGIHAVMDSGGWLEDGMTAGNRSGKPEPVFNNSQWHILEANIAKGVNPLDEVILIVEGEPITARIKKNNAAGIQQLRRGRKP